MTAADEQAFALDLLGRLGPTSGNLVISPSSIATVLAMLEPGAAGNTASGIANALHSPDLAPSAQAQGSRALQAELSAQAAEDHLVLESANRVFLETGFPVRAAYAELLGQDFDSEVQEADFKEDPSGSAREVNKWVSSHTGGHINNLVNPLQLTNVVALLVDAIYMSALWATPFDASATAVAAFHVNTSLVVKVPTMSTPLFFNAPAVVSPSLDAAELAYKGGHFAALLIMPPLGAISNYERSFTPARLSQVIGALRPEALDLRVPKFSLTTKLLLNNVLSAMGMHLAFSDHADFSNISVNPVMLAFVVHQAQIKVNEKGTEASAATAAGIEPTAYPAHRAELDFDHPFLFIVRDVDSGAVLFEAQVVNPTV